MLAYINYFYFTLGVSAYLSVVSSINITGNLQPGVSNPHAPGQPIQLNFTVTVNSHDFQAVNDLQMVFTCDDMKGNESAAASTQSDWSLMDGNNTCDRNNCAMNVTETISTDGEMITILFNQMTVHDTDISGFFIMTINEDVEIASTTKCNTHVSLVLSHTNEYVEVDVTSSDIHFKPPVFAFELIDDPLPVSKQANLSLRMWMTPGIIKPTFFVTNPILSSYEPKLTVTKMVMSDQGSNVRIDSDTGKEERTFYTRSTEKWTRTDLGRSYQTASWIVSGGSDTSANNSVSYAAQLRMEDWNGVENGSKMWTTMSCKIHADLMWVGRYMIATQDNGTRTPELIYSAKLIDHRTIQSSKKIVIKGRFTIKHRDTSTAYARNVIVKWYTLPYVSFLSRTRTDNIFYPVNPTNTGGDQSTLSFTIPRLLFSDSGLLEFEFSHPVNPVKDFSFLDVTTYTALTELQYSVTTNGTTKVFMGDVTFSSRTVQAFLDPEVCYCIPGDNASGTCPCCEENYISCGVTAPGVCVQQDVAWLCHEVRPEHWQLTQYEWSQSSYVCNRRITENSNKLHSCFQQTSWKGPWNGVDPNVGTVLGRNAFTNKLYATTNNGAGCVETEDDTTWIGISCMFVEQLEGRWWYKKAQSLDVDEDRPYAVRGSADGIRESDLHNNCNSTSIVLDDPSCEGQPLQWNFQTTTNTSLNPNETYSTDVWYSGTSSCKMQHVENITTGTMYQILSLPSGTQDLVLTVYTKTKNVTNSTTGEYGIFIQKLNASGHATAEEYTWITNITSEWTLSTVYMYHKNTINHVKIGATFIATKGSAFFDDFQLAAYEKPEPYICMTV